MQGFMRDGQLLEKQEIDKMYVHFPPRPLSPSQLSFVSRHIPTIIVQGRYDVVCPVRRIFLDPLRDIGIDACDCQATTAWALKRVWPEVTLYIIPDAGHSSREPGIEKKLVEAADTMVSKGL